MPGCFMGVPASLYSQCACHAGLVVVQKSMFADLYPRDSLIINGLCRLFGRKGRQLAVSMLVNTGVTFETFETLG